ncbi:hypothetical protein [Deinococcus sp. S9]|uniref:hypothetical protein n=1 Tax=Deinococcus sp. S9 TaxID=2545754 RepID=UPI001054E07C|nr:hypothetical protein [Deinococcus sp. S9]TDE85587.1 hypothetical protein E0686_11285 [Deinococcus sp. S9]
MTQEALTPKSKHLALEARVEALEQTPPASAAWDTLEGRPDAFPPASHTHPISEVDGLQSALNTKANASSLGALTTRVSTLETQGLPATVVTDGTTITGDGTAEHPLVAHLTGDGSGLPAGGAPGQVLTWTAEGLIWADPPSSGAGGGTEGNVYELNPKYAARVGFSNPNGFPRTVLLRTTITSTHITADGANVRLAPVAADGSRGAETTPLVQRVSPFADSGTTYAVWWLANVGANETLAWDVLYGDPRPLVIQAPQGVYASLARIAVAVSGGGYLAFRDDNQAVLPPADASGTLLGDWTDSGVIAGPLLVPWRVGGTDYSTLYFWGDGQVTLGNTSGDDNLVLTSAPSTDDASARLAYYDGPLGRVFLWDVRFPWDVSGDVLRMALLMRNDGALVVTQYAGVANNTNSSLTFRLGGQTYSLGAAPNGPLAEPRTLVLLPDRIDLTADPERDLRA